jgi:hypothetical protein
MTRRRMRREGRNEQDARAKLAHRFHTSYRRLEERSQGKEPSLFNHAYLAHPTGGDELPKCRKWLGVLAVPLGHGKAEEVPE